MADIELASRLAGGMLGLLVDEPSVMIVEPGSVTSVTNPTRLPAPSSGTSLMRSRTGDPSRSSTAKTARAAIQPLRVRPPGQRAVTGQTIMKGFQLI